MLGVELLPMVLSRPPTTTVGSTPARSRIVAIIDVVEEERPLEGERRLLRRIGDIECGVQRRLQVRERPAHRARKHEFEVVERAALDSQSNRIHGAEVPKLPRQIDRFNG